MNLLRLRKRILRFCQFARAVVLGSWYMANFVRWKPRNLWKIATVQGSRVVFALRHGPADYSHLRKALIGCNRCPLYDRERKVCGTSINPKSLFSMQPLLHYVLDTLTRLKLPFGCRCWIPLKGSHPDSVCFLAEHGMIGQWTLEQPFYERHFSHYKLAMLKREPRTPETIFVFGSPTECKACN